MFPLRRLPAMHQEGRGAEYGSRAGAPNPPPHQVTAHPVPPNTSDGMLGPVQYSSIYRPLPYSYAVGHYTYLLAFRPLSALDSPNPSSAKVPPPAPPLLLLL
jgi:hypothetical protein